MNLILINTTCTSILINPCVCSFFMLFGVGKMSTRMAVIACMCLTTEISGDRWTWKLNKTINMLADEASVVHFTHLPKLQKSEW